jgi:hypothetical protein
VDLDGDGHLDILSGSYSRMDKDMAGLFQGIRSRAEGDMRAVPEVPENGRSSNFSAETTKKRPGGNFATGFSLSRGQHFGK